MTWSNVVRRLRRRQQTKHPTVSAGRLLQSLTLSWNGTCTSWARNIASVVLSHSGGATVLPLGFWQNKTFYRALQSCRGCKRYRVATRRKHWLLFANILRRPTGRFPRSCVTWNFHCNVPSSFSLKAAKSIEPRLVPFQSPSVCPAKTIEPSSHMARALPTSALPVPPWSNMP